MTAESELSGFIEKFAPPMQTLITGCLAAMQSRFPAAIQLVYDNYNFLVVGFGPTRRPSEAIFSLAAQRAGVSLYFLQRAVELSDPGQLLRGVGKVVRSIPLSTAAELERPEVAELLTTALSFAVVPMDASGGPELIIKSVSARQRPRR